MTNTRAALFTAACLVLVGNALAECEFPYYPEYADIFSQYDEVTPSMVKKQVISEPMLGFDPGNVVCEPLVIKDVNGMPFCYMVATYRGDDLEVARRWNKLVRAINEGSPVNAEELAEDISFFKTPEITASFARQTIPTFTFEIPMVRASDKGIPFAFSHYDKAFRFAKNTLGNGEIYLNRVIAESYDYYQTFEFQAGDRNVVITINPENEETEITASDVVGLRAKDRVKGWADGIMKKGPNADKNRLYWIKLNAGIPDTEVEKEFPVIHKPVNE